MGLMEHPETRCIITPHPVTLDGQQNIAAEMAPGEKLGAFLARTVPGWETDLWEVRVNGHVVPAQLLPHVRPKPGAVIEVRGAVNRQALQIVAQAALIYFTFGFGTATAGMWGAGAAASAFGGGVAGALFATGAYFAGSMLINRVLGPKLPGARTRDQNPVYSISQFRNQARHYEPLPLVFGTVKYAPDVISNPYWWFEGDDQYMGVVMTPGINAHSVEALYNGETVLTSYEGVQVYHSGFPGMPEQPIPLYSNADTIAGGELEKDVWVERTTSTGTVRIQVNLEYVLGDVTSKGKPKRNTAYVDVEYRQTGTTTWLPATTRMFVNDTYDPKRATLSFDVPEGQYDVRVRRREGLEIENAKAQFQWSTMTCVQRDTADYSGIPRIGILAKASGQLASGVMDEVNCVVHSRPIPVWNGSAWVTEETSNPGAQILAYARGIYDEDGRLLAGMGLPDSMIDIPALQAFMLHCAAEGYTYDNVVREPRTHGEMLDALALAGFGQMTWQAGRLSVVWAAEGQPLSGVVNMATIRRGTFQVDYTLADAADGVEFTYYDRSDWTTKTLRVNKPGVTVALNPAQIQGEGITTEAHAAQMARWHLAQSLYQYKEVTFGTDLEHLSYRRMSVLALQHDLTQWGYGGRLRGASIVGGIVSLALDEEVPAGASPYIGLRIPGELVYRVFRVQALSEPSSTVTLLDPWPEDAPLPGDSDDNPAWDTIWVYDFKATPGYRVRVVGIEPDADYESATIRVVPESQELWTYVKTGSYVPPASGSLLPVKPVASNLQISEAQVVQGDTVYTELVCRFSVSGPMAFATVHAAQQLDGDWTELVQVAETRTTVARFRIPSAGIYKVVVRPYNADGIVGGVAETTYVTVGADVPPPPFDTVGVQALGGGVRRYFWGYNSTTLQAPDYAGAEVRYIAGTHADPDWDAMQPVVGDGFHTAPFEAVVPDAGTYTFAFRARNTSGLLSPQTVVTTTLPASLGETLDEQVQDLVAVQEALDAEVQARLAGDLATAQQAADDAQERADAALQAAKSYADQVAAGAGEWDEETVYAEGDVVFWDGRMYQSLEDENEGNQPDLSPSAWREIGEYASLGQAVASAITLSEQTASELEAEAQRIDVVQAQLSSDNAGDEDWNAGDEDVYAGTLSVYSAYASADLALSRMIESAQSEIEGKASASALQQLESTVERHGDAISAQASAITSVQAEVAGKASASVVQEMQAIVEEHGDEITQILAQYFLAVNVNGRIAGMKLGTDGTTSAVEFLADIFRVVSPGSVEGMEWQAGYLRIYGAGYQRIIGHSFGVPGDQLVDYFGPNVGAAAASKANAVMWMDKSGNAHWGGTVTSGIITAGNRSTVVGDVTLSTGAFATKGGTRVIQYGMNYSRSYTSATQTAAALSCVLTLQRRLNGGAWTTIDSLPVMGMQQVVGPESGGYLIAQGLGGSTSFFDNSGGSGTLEYRVLLGSRVNWPTLAGAGNQQTYINATEY